LSSWFFYSSLASFFDSLSLSLSSSFFCLPLGLIYLFVFWVSFLFIFIPFLWFYLLFFIFLFFIYLYSLIL
jgi:hypothetical protein